MSLDLRRIVREVLLNEVRGRQMPQPGDRVKLIGKPVTGTVREVPSIGSGAEPVERNVRGFLYFPVIFGTITSTIVDVPELFGVVEDIENVKYTGGRDPRRIKPHQILITLDSQHRATKYADWTVRRPSDSKPNEELYNGDTVERNFWKTMGGDKLSVHMTTYRPVLFDLKKTKFQAT